MAKNFSTETQFCQWIHSFTSFKQANEDYTYKTIEPKVVVDSDIFEIPSGKKFGSKIYFEDLKLREPDFDLDPAVNWPEKGLVKEPLTFSLNIMYANNMCDIFARQNTKLWIGSYNAVSHYTAQTAPTKAAFEVVTTMQEYEIKKCCETCKPQDYFGSVYYSPGHK